MTLTGGVDGPVRSDRRRDVEAGTLSAAGSSTGRRGWTGRPRKGCHTERALAHSGWIDRRQEIAVAHHAYGVVGRDLDQPGIDQARIHIDGLVGERDRVVIDVSVAIGAERARDERVGISDAKGTDARHDCPVPPIEFEDTAAEARVVHMPVREHRMVNGLPLGELDAHGLPVAMDRPLLDQLAALPVQPFLIPGLAGPGRLAAVRLARRRVPGSWRATLDEAAAFELHKDILSIDQRYLVVD